MFYYGLAHIPLYSKPTICSRMLQREFPTFASSISDLSVSSGIVLIPVLLDLLTISVPCILSELFFLPDLYITDMANLVPWMVLGQSQAETFTTMLVTTNDN